MTLKEFCLLPERNKIDLLYKEGVYVGKRYVNNTPVLLYQLEGFYVEIHYRRYRSSIASTCCFSGTKKLDPYLAQMGVVHLVV